MTLGLLIQARDKLKSLKIFGVRKQVIWKIMTFLFLGSFRGSEILATDSKRYDPAKTLCGEYLKLINVKAQGEDLETIQVRLKQPRHPRPSPTRLWSSLPQVDGSAW